MGKQEILQSDDGNADWLLQLRANLKYLSYLDTGTHYYLEISLLDIYIPGKFSNWFIKEYVLGFSQ